MFINYKLYTESLKDRTDASFEKWYIKFKSMSNEEEIYQFNTKLNAWNIFKPYFSNKDIFSYKTFEDFEIELVNAKSKYVSKLKNIKEDVDYTVIYKDDDVKIIKPLTLQGSCKYGFNAKWCTAMIERPKHFEDYKRSGVLYRFIFDNDKKISLHWANNGNKFWKDQLNVDIPVEYNFYMSQTWVLHNTPFELPVDAKIKVSVDYITEKWNYEYCKKWRNSRKIKTIDDYIRYYKLWFIDQ